MIRFVNPNIPQKKPKATIHATGKLGFNKDAQEFMKLEKGIFFLLAINDDEYDGVLYLKKQDHKEERTVTITQAGNYFYLNLADFFRIQKIDYKNYVYVFNIEKEETDVGFLFVLKAENRKLRKKSNPSAENDSTPIAEEDQDGANFQHRHKDSPF